LRKGIEMIDCHFNTMHVRVEGEMEVGIDLIRSSGNDFRRAYIDVRSPSSIPGRTKSPKVGRNEPCPCGSGQKYKKCHGAI